MDFRRLEWSTHGGGFCGDDRSRRKGQNGFWAYLLFGYIGAMLVNVSVPHIPATLVFRSYTPGVVTAALINLPLMSTLAYCSVRDRWVMGRKAVVFAVVVPIVIGGMIPILFMKGKMTGKVMGEPGWLGKMLP
jgi:Protein of unknown function with HXXEE motif